MLDLQKNSVYTVINYRETRYLREPLTAHKSGTLYRAILGYLTPFNRGVKKQSKKGERNYVKKEVSEPRRVFCCKDKSGQAYRDKSNSGAGVPVSDCVRYNVACAGNAVEPARVGKAGHRAGRPG